MKPGWHKVPFDAVIADESGGNIKTLQSEFLAAGHYAVVDQGKELVAGYVNDESCLCRAQLPVIVFGDHTRCFKYVDFPFCMGADGIKILRPKIDADVKYLYHYFRQLRLTEGGYDRHFKYLKRVDVVLPPLPEQRRIAEVLDRTEALRTKRLAALAQLDTLTQSILCDLFGDLATNTKGWPVRAVGGMVVGVTNGMTRRRSESDSGANIVLRLRDIRSGWIDFSDVNRITLTSEESSRYEVLPGDILFIRVNGNPDYVGRCALFPGYPEPVYFNDHIMRVTLDRSVVSGVFLTFVLNGPHGKREIALHRKTSAGQHTINQDGLSRIRIPLPPMHLQDEFARRVAVIEKLRNTYQLSLIGLDEFFASLQHRAFQGEL